MKRIFMFVSLIAIIAAPFMLSSAKSDSTQNEASLERRQKVEFKRFFFGGEKNAAVPKASFSIQAFNDAVEYYQNEEFDLARKSLEEALRQDSANGYAYELLGDIDYEEQKLKSAKENYQMAYNLSPAKRIKDKLEKLSTQAVVEKKLSTYKDKNFIIKYFRGQKEYEGYELRNMLRGVYRQISKSFAHYMKRQIVVLLYDNEQDFAKVTDLPHWVSGVYDGKVRMPINIGGYNKSDLEALAAHEVTHAFVSAMSSRRAPPWINEGLAEYQERKVSRETPSVFNAAVKSGTLFTLDELFISSGPTSLSDATKISLFYEQSYMLVDYIIDRYSMFHVKKLLKAFGKGENADQAIRKILMTSVKQLEKEWLKSI